MRELIKCGSSPECVENVLKCARKVNPDQPATPVLYKEALQQVLKAAIHSYQDSGPDGNPTEGQDSDSVRMILVPCPNMKLEGVCCYLICLVSIIHLDLLLLLLLLYHSYVKGFSCGEQGSHLHHDSFLQG